MSLWPTPLMLSSNMCDPHPWRQEPGASLFSLSFGQQFLLRGAGQLARAIHG